MSKQKCRSCGEPMGLMDSTCPHCGHKSIVNFKYGCLGLLIPVFLLFFICIIAIATDGDYSIPVPDYYDSAQVAEYEILEIKDISILVGGKKNIRKTIKILVPLRISVDELKSTLIHAGLGMARKNEDIDEISISSYERRDLSRSGGFTMGKADWCPSGNWAGVTRDIAASNDRSTYKFAFLMNKKVGNMDRIAVPSEREFEISGFQDSLIYDPKRGEKSDEQIEAKIVRKFNITKKELNAIEQKVLSYSLGEFIK